MQSTTTFWTFLCTTITAIAFSTESLAQQEDEAPPVEDFAQLPQTSFDESEETYDEQYEAQEQERLRIEQERREAYEREQKSQVSPLTLEVIQNRKYQLLHEFTFSGANLPADPYYKGIAGTVSYTFHILDSLAWDIAQFTYVYRYDTKLKKEVQRIANNGALEVPEFPEIEWFLATHLVLKPMYGKEAIFNKDIVHLEVYLQLGPALVHTVKLKGRGGKPTKDTFDIGVDFGFGVRLWLTEVISFRMDLGELVYYSSRPTDSGVKLGMHLHAGFSFNLRGED